MLLVGTVPPKCEEVIGRNSPNKKLKRLLVGTVPPKKMKRLMIRAVPTKKIEEVIGKNSPAKNKFMGRNIPTNK